MPDHAPELDQPASDRVYRQYLVTCERLEPVPRECAQEFIAEWSDAIASGRSVPAAKH